MQHAGYKTVLFTKLGYLLIVNCIIIESTLNLSVVILDRALVNCYVEGITNCFDVGISSLFPSLKIILTWSVF